MRLHFQPQADEQHRRSAKVTIEVVSKDRPVYFTGTRALEVRPGFVILEIPPLEHWSEQLDALLDRLHAHGVHQSPLLVSIDGPAGNLTIGLGHPEGVLSFVQPDSDPPYLVSTNQSKDETEIDFSMDGHHSPFMAKHLIPMDLARKAVRVFVEHGALLADVRWSEV